VFFRLNATQAQIAAVKHRLSRDRDVAEFRLSAGPEAFEELRKKYPDLVKNLTGNPLPARIEVQLRSGVDRARFVDRYVSLSCQASVGQQPHTPKFSTANEAPFLTIDKAGRRHAFTGLVTRNGPSWNPSGIG